MIPDAFRLRRAAVAYVFPSQPEIKREDGLSFYDRITGQGVDLPQFNIERNTITLQRISSGSPSPKLQIEVGHHEGNFRLLIAESWPDRALELVKQDANIVWQSFTSTWDPKRYGGRPVLVESNTRLDVPADGGDATEFLVDHCMRLSRDKLNHLGRGLQGVGLKLVFPVEVQVGEGEPDDKPLSGANGTVNIETLLDDQSRLYLELKSQWPTLPVPPEVRQQTGGPERINPEPLEPSHYVSQTYEYLTDRVSRFLLATDEE